MPIFIVPGQAMQRAAAPSSKQRHGSCSRPFTNQPPLPVGAKRSQLSKEKCKVASFTTEPVTRTSFASTVDFPEVGQIATIAIGYTAVGHSGLVAQVASPSFSTLTASNAKPYSSAVDFLSKQGSKGLLQPAQPLAEPSSDPDTLHKQIENSISWQAVLELVDGSKSYLCPRNTAKALGMLAKFGKASSQEHMVACVRDARFGLLIRLANKHVSSMQPKYLANSFYSFGALKVALPSQLLAAYASQIEAQLSNLKLQDVAMIMYGYAVMKHNPGNEQLSHLVNRAQSLLTKTARIVPQDVTMLVWSCATLQYQDFHAKALVTSLMKLLPEGFTGYGTQSVSNTMWALTKLGRTTAKELGNAARYMDQNLQRFKPMELSNMLWVMAVNRHHPEHLLEEALLAAAAQASALNGEDVVRIFYSMAMFGHLPEAAALQRLTERAEQLLSAMKPQELCCLLWALALAGLPNTRVFNDICEMLPELYSRNALDDLDLRQTCQAHIKAGISGVHMRFPKPMLDAMRAAWVAEVSNVPVGGVPMVLSSTLKRLRVPHECRVPTKDGLSMVDIAFRAGNGRHIALQIVHPQDSCANTGQFMGPLRFQRDVLEAAGWQVKFLPAQQFSAIKPEVLPMFVAELVKGLGYTGPLAVEAAVAALKARKQERQQRAAAGDDLLSSPEQAQSRPAVQEVILPGEFTAREQEAAMAVVNQARAVAQPSPLPRRVNKIRLSRRR